MKAICALALLSLTWAFEDDEFFAHPVHPAFLQHHNKDFEIGESLLNTPKKFLDFDVTKAPKIFNADDNDNEFFSTQNVEENGVALALKFLHQAKTYKPLESLVGDSIKIMQKMLRIIIKKNSKK